MAESWPPLLLEAPRFSIILGAIAAIVLLLIFVFIRGAIEHRAPSDSPSIALLRQLNRVYMRLVHGLPTPARDPLPPEGARLLVANHRSGLDPTAIISQTRRPIRFLMAREYYEIPVLHRLFRSLEMIPVNRDGSDLAATKRALGALRKGRVVGIFPHGGIITERSPVPAGETGNEESGEDVHLKNGAALLALRTGVTIQPVRVEGTPSKDSVLLAFLIPSRSRITFGEPFRLPEPAGRSPSREELREGTRRILEAIERAAVEPPRSGSTSRP